MTATLAPIAPSHTTAAPVAAAIAERFSFLDFRENPTVIASHRASGKPMDAGDIVRRSVMRDGEYVFLPLVVAYEKAEKLVGGDFWTVYPRSLTVDGVVFTFLGTHVGDREVYYRHA